MIRDNIINYNKAYNNNANARGGGIFHYMSKSSIIGNLFVGNQSDYYGGAISSHKGWNFLIQNNQFLYNKANAGGGIYFIEVTQNLIINNLFAYNTSGLSGGGIRISLSIGGGVQSLCQNTFFGNSSSTAGGGIYFKSITNATCVLYDSVLWNNLTEPGYGHEIYFTGQAIGSCTFVIYYSDVQEGLTGGITRVQNRIFAEFI